MNRNITLILNKLKRENVKLTTEIDKLNTFLINNKTNLKNKDNQKIKDKYVNDNRLKINYKNYRYHLLSEKNKNNVNLNFSNAKRYDRYNKFN